MTHRPRRNRKRAVCTSKAHIDRRCVDA